MRTRNRELWRGKANNERRNANSGNTRNEELTIALSRYRCIYSSINRYKWNARAQEDRERQQGKKESREEEHEQRIHARDEKRTIVLPLCRCIYRSINRYKFFGRACVEVGKRKSRKGSGSWSDKSTEKNAQTEAPRAGKIAGKFKL